MGSIGHGTGLERVPTEFWTMSADRAPDLNCIRSDRTVLSGTTYPLNLPCQTIPSSDETLSRPAGLHCEEGQACRDCSFWQGPHTYTKASKCGAGKLQSLDRRNRCRAIAHALLIEVAGTRVCARYSSDANSAPCSRPQSSAASSSRRPMP